MANFLIVLDYMRENNQEDYLTISEISKELGLKRDTVANHIYDLARRGFLLQKCKGKSANWYRAYKWKKSIDTRKSGE